MDKLRTYINSLPNLSEQTKFAERCKCSLGYMRKIVYGRNRYYFSEALAKRIQQECGKKSGVAVKDLVNPK